MDAFEDDDEDDEDADDDEEDQPRQRPATLRASFIGEAEKFQLVVKKGDEVTVLKVRKDWAWCIFEDREGWVPMPFLLQGESRKPSRDVRAKSLARAPSLADWLGVGDEPEVPFNLPSMPPRWAALLKGTLTFHTVQNALRLVQYLQALLPRGYAQVSQLHIACCKGKLDDVKRVVLTTPNAVRHWHSRDGELTPLHVALVTGHQEIVEYLLAEGAAPTVPTTHDLQPLHIAAAVMPEVVKGLLSKKADVGARTKNNDTPLHFACATDRLDAAEVLLQAQADASAANSWGTTPLHLAAAHAGIRGKVAQDATLALQLAAAGAKPWAADQHGLIPAATAIQAGGQASLVAVLHGMAATDSHRTVKEGTPEAVALRVRRIALSLLQGDLEMLEDEGEEAGHDGGAKVNQSDRRLAPTLTDALSDLHEARAENVRFASQLLSEAKPAATPQSDLAEARNGADAPSPPDVDSLKQQELQSELQHLKEEIRLAAQSRQDKELQSELHHMKEEMQLAEQSGQEKVGSLMSEHAENRRALAFAQEEARRALSIAQEEAQQEVATMKQRARRALAIAEEEVATVKQRASEEQSMSEEAKQALAAARNELTTERFGNTEELQQRLVAEAAQRATDADHEASHALAETSEVRAAAQKELAAMRAEMAQATSEAANHLEAAQSELKNKAATLTDEARQWSVKDEENRNALSAAEKRLSEEHKEMSQAEGRFATQSEKFGSELTELRTEKQSSLEEIQSLRAQVAEKETWKTKAEEAQNKLKPYQERLEELRAAFAQEQAMRKRYHNQMQDLKGAVRVFARIRPPVAREKGEAVAATRMDGFSLELKNKDGRSAKTFQFDSVFDATATQEEVFDECRALVLSALDGYNVTIFAYGQTGAGKTHTMYGSETAPGLVPRVADELFRSISRYGAEMEASIKCYMLELYRDDLSDLLAKPKGKSPRVPASQGPPALVVKQDSSGSVYVENASIRPVASKADLLKAIQDGNALRHVAATKMNADSSRSHLIVTILAEVSNTKTKQVQTGKLTLCDLAGSERLKKSEASGEQMKEAQSINKSLTALGDVIEALTKKDKHVPYRNHKLTQLLSDSLGGNAKTLMFVNCSPVASNADETSSSLSYAARAKLIVNKVEKSQETFEVSKLKKSMKEMEAELEKYRSQAAEHRSDELASPTAGSPSKGS